MRLISRFHSIRARFLAGILLIAVPALAALALLQDRYVTRLMMTVAESQFSNDVLDAADGIQSLADAARHQLRTLADLEAPFAGTPQEAARLDAAFRASLPADGVFVEFARLDARGRVVSRASAAGATGATLLPSAVDLAGFVVRDGERDPARVGVRPMTVGAPNRSANQSLLLLTQFGDGSANAGYLVGVVNPAALVRYFTDAALSGGRSLFLADATGRPIAYADETISGAAGDRIPTQLPYPDGIRRQIVRGGSGLISRGYPMLVSFTELGDDHGGDLPRWIVGESMPRDLLLANIADLRRHTLLVLALTALAAMVLAFLLARQITRPIEALRVGAARIAGGELDFPLAITSHDEVGKLAGSFQAMTASVRSSLTALHDERRMLEQRVDERTAQLRRQGEELEQTYEQLRSVDRMKSAFITNVSHELRTPLTMLRGAVELLAFTGAQDGPSHELVQIAVDGVERLNVIVRKILDYRDVEAGVAMWSMEQVEPAAVARAVYDAYAAEAGRKDIVFTLAVQNDMPTVWACTDKLRMALANLVANAVTFAPAGGSVGIGVTCATDADECTWVEIAVQDNGPGVAEADMPRLLECFEQGGSQLTAKPQGVGLGLPVARRIAEHLGGTLRIASTVGTGSTFTLVLPATRAAATGDDMALAA